MKRPVIFSGTTEGRYMSERLSEEGVSHVVCVATEYGSLVMEENEYAEIKQGRLGEDEMESLIIEEASAVFDATHPYAAAVSENICEACRNTGCGYVRIIRGETDVKDAGADIRIFDDAAGCAQALKETGGNILLTTGSKELDIYAADEEVRGRLFARVLPSEESIRLCSDAGLSGRQIIAMQGPFSKETDLAAIHQYDIGVLVTKSSGKAGGFEDKVMAAAEAGIPVFMIGRPSDESGVTPDDALELFFGIAPAVRIDLVGTGPGRASLMTREAYDAVSRADILFGAPRMTEAYEGRETYPYYRADDIIPVIAERMPKRAAVLLSGDTGFFSGAAALRPELEKWLKDRGCKYEINIHPGISAISYFASRLGRAYSDAELCSMHGKSDDESNTAEIISTIESSPEVYVLMSGPEDIRKLGGMLSECGLEDCRIVIGKDLAADSEEIHELGPGECMNVSNKGLYTALVLNPDVRAAEQDAGRPLMPVLSDDSFERGAVPMTKESTRHLSVLKLGLTEGSAVFDVGAGTGSVACEIAAQSKGLRVYAIEKKPEACELIKKNAELLGLENIRVICGEAPEAFSGLEAPKHVFIGGSTGKLKNILSMLATAPEPARIVINAVSLETMAEIQSVIKTFDVSDVSVEQVSVSRSRELGDHHLMTAENPVMIASFILKGTKK